MDGLSETAALGRSLRTWLQATERGGLTAAETTDLLTRKTSQWAKMQGWTPAFEVPARISRPTRSGPRRGRLDIVVTRPNGLAPIAIEIDRQGKVWSLRKLVAESDAGAVALWVRWKGRTLASIPATVGLVELA
jgi:hypothetical protein